MSFLRVLVVFVGTTLAANASTTLASRFGGGLGVVRTVDLLFGGALGVALTRLVLGIPLKWSLLLVVGFLLGRETVRWMQSRLGSQRA